MGLDSDIRKIPEFLLKEEDPVFEFNRRIIDATLLNMQLLINQMWPFMRAGEQRDGSSLERTANYIKSKLP